MSRVQLSLIGEPEQPKDPEMKENAESDASRPRKPYTKPEVTKVSLRPEEAVLGACKAGRVSGPGQPRCGVPAPCSSLGS